MTNPNTVATPIVDKNGKKTTVHKKVDSGKAVSARAASVAAPPSVPSVGVSSDIEQLELQRMTSLSRKIPQNPDDSGMSNLEHVLRNATGINVLLRGQLIKAYHSEDGAATIPELLNTVGSDGVDSELLPVLKRLAANEDMSIYKAMKESVEEDIAWELYGN